MDLYEIVSGAVPVYTALVCGGCFAWYAGRVFAPRTRFSVLLCAASCVSARIVLSTLLADGSGSGPTALRTAAMLGVFLAALYAFYRVRTRMAVYAALSFCALFELSFFAAYSIIAAADPLYGLLSARMEEAGSVDPTQYAAAARVLAAGLQCAFSAVLTAVCIVSCRHLARDVGGRQDDLTGAELRLLCLPAASGILIVLLLRTLMVSITSGTVQYLFDAHPALRILVPAIAVVTLLSVVYAARTCKDMAQLADDRRAGLAAQERLRALRERVAETEAADARLRKMRHDLRNTLVVIRGLSAQDSGNGELASYLDSVEADAADLDRPYETGDSVADVLLAAKARELDTAAPGTVLDAGGLMIPADSGISSYDLGLILGNALDNAIEAVASQESGERYIAVSSFGRGDVFGLSVRNSCSGDEIQVGSDGLPVSRRGSDHGIGMHTIRDTARRHGGTMDWRAEGGTFTLAVMLRAPGQAKTEDGTDPD